MSPLLLLLLLLLCVLASPLASRFALLEKAKGNECFKAGEADEAMAFYSRALALLDDGHEQTPVCWANRAMAALKLGLLERAEEDCTMALELCPAYHKAQLRRGMVRYKRGRYALALADFEDLVAAGAPIADLPKLAARSRDKLREAQGDSGGNGNGSSSLIAELGSKVRVAVAAGPPPPLGGGWEMRPFVDPPPPVVLSAAGEDFTKVPIAFDDSESEEEKEEKKEAGMTRVAIEDDDGSSSEDSGGAINPDTLPPVAFTRVAIEEGDSESESDVDEPVVEDMPRAAAGRGGAGGGGQGGEIVSEWEVDQLKQTGVKRFMASDYPGASAAFSAALAGIEAAAAAGGVAPDALWSHNPSIWNALRNNLAACCLAVEDWAGVVAQKHAEGDRMANVMVGSVPV